MERASTLVSTTAEESRTSTAVVAEHRPSAGEPLCMGLSDMARIIYSGVAPLTATAVDPTTSAGLALVARNEDALFDVGDPPAATSTGQPALNLHTFRDMLAGEGNGGGAAAAGEKAVSGGVYGRLGYAPAVAAVVAVDKVCTVRAQREAQVVQLS